MAHSCCQDTITKELQPLIVDTEAIGIYLTRRAVCKGNLVVLPFTRIETQDIGQTSQRLFVFLTEEPLNTVYKSTKHTAV